MAEVGDVTIKVKVISEPITQKCLSDFGDHKFNSNFIGRDSSWALISSTLLLVCESCAMTVEVNRVSGS
jgi:hypothetical protein